MKVRGSKKRGSNAPPLTDRASKPLPIDRGEKVPPWGDRGVTILNEVSERFKLSNSSMDQLADDNKFMA